MHWCSRPVPPRPHGKLLKSSPSTAAVPFGMTTVDCAAAGKAATHVANRIEVRETKAEVTCMAGSGDETRWCGVVCRGGHAHYGNRAPGWRRSVPEVDLDRLRDAVVACDAEPAEQQAFAALHVEHIVAVGEHDGRVAETVGGRVEAASGERELGRAFVLAAAR